MISNKKQKSEITLIYNNNTNIINKLYAHSASNCRPSN